MLRCQYRLAVRKGSLTTSPSLSCSKLSKILTHNLEILLKWVFAEQHVHSQFAIINKDERSALQLALKLAPIYF